MIPDKTSSSSTNTKVLDDEGTVSGAGGGAGAAATVTAPDPLPVQIIERNRLSVAEIRALPRFRDYRPGVPNKVLQSSHSFCHYCAAWITCIV